MNNENLEVLEMEKQPSVAYQTAEMNGNDMADDFFDDDLVELDFNGLESNVSDNKFSFLNQNFDVNETQNNDTKIEVENENKEDINTTLFDSFTNLNEEKINDVEPIDVNFENKDSLDNNYNLSNFDVVFDSLYNDVVGANNLITDLIEKKSSLNKNEKLLEDFKEQFEKEKEDFRIFVEEQKKAIENEKNQANSFIESKRTQLRNEELKFNEDSESKKKEISLLEQSLKLEREKFESAKANFEEKNKLELERIKTEQEKLDREKEQFEKDKKLSFETIENIQKDLQVQQEQFAKYKELEQKKLDLEEKNLSQSCARFKELVSQFNSGFEQLPNND